MEQKRKFDRRNKGGRPKKGAADKLKYRLTVNEDGDIGLLHAERQGTECGHFRRRIPAWVHEGQAGEGTAHAGAYWLHPPALRHGEQSQPACTQGERGWLRHREAGMPCAGRTYRGSA